MGNVKGRMQSSISGVHRAKLTIQHGKLARFIRRERDAYIARHGRSATRQGCVQYIANLIERRRC